MRVGPFKLDEPIGTGATGEVWRARSPGGDFLAVKLIDAKRARRERFRRNFRREVEAMARFRHPNVAAIFEVGETEVDGEVRPWLAMELLEGSVHDVVESVLVDWPSVRSLLFDVLDGLAHAHARGMLHRDLKPANVLVTKASGSPRFKLADFGIALPMGWFALKDTTDIDFRSAGTPLYMAPEQITAQWRWWLPWTDLYAVGGLAWELCTGRAPFHGDDAFEVGYRQLEEEPPAFEPRFPVPDELEGWLRRLLHKKPYRRFERCADAAWRLAQMPDADGRALDDQATRGPARTLTFLDVPTVLFETRDLFRTVDPGADPDESGDVAFRDEYLDAPPIPADWRGAVDGAPAAPTGLGLFGMRDVPLVGHEDVRDTLWAALRETEKDRSCRVILLDGPSGSGASTIGKWLGERSAELGAAVSLTVEAGGGGLREALSRFLVTQGLSREATHRRLLELFTLFGKREVVEPVAEAVTDMLVEGESDESTMFDRLFRSGARERFVALARVLRSMVRVRPLVLFVDDLHVSIETVGFIDYLARASGKIGPVLVVATIRREPDAMTAAIDRLAERPVVRTLTLEPAGFDECVRVIHHMLALHPDAARAVARAAGGDVLTARELLTSLVERGALVLEGDHFVLGATSLEPVSRVDVWRERFDSVARRFGGERSSAEAALSLAAVIGADVRRDEWCAACARHGIDDAFVERLLDSVVTAGLVRRRPTGVRFEHATARDALLDRLGDRAATFHALVADALTAFADTPERRRRRARHLEAAGEFDAAFDAMFAGLQSASWWEARADGVLRLQRLLDRIDPPADDERRVRLAVEAARVDLHHRRLDRVERTVRELLERRRRHDWAAMEPEIFALEGQLHAARGDTQAARQAHLRAWKSARRTRNRVAEATVIRRYLDSVTSLGSADEARQLGRRGIEILDELGDERAAAWTRYSLGAALYHGGEFDDARQHYREALETFRELADRYGIASTSLALAQIAAGLGDFERAVLESRDALEAFEAIGMSTLVPDLSLTTYLLRRGDVDEAAGRVPPLLEQVRERGNPYVLAYGLALSLAVSAVLGRRDEFDTVQGELASVLADQDPFEDPDFDALVEIAATAWRDRDDDVRHEAARALGNSR